MNRILAAATASALVFAAPALAQSGDRARQMFEQADTNHDGVLDLAEWKASGHRERGFNLIDADHDGKITPQELAAAAARFGR